MKNRKRLFGFLFLCFASLASLFCQVRTGQNKVFGLVVDSEKSIPIPSVNVFVKGTTRGTSTLIDGRYELPNLPEGEFDLIFSLVGYERDIKHISLKDSVILEINISLKPREIGLSEVEITGSAEAWKKLLPVFSLELLGATKNAEECTIINPEVVNLSLGSTGDSLRAFTDTTLVVENAALGYRVYLQIERFLLVPRLGRFEMNCYPRYEEMQPQDKSQREEWNKRRDQAYHYSFRHFVQNIIEQRGRSKEFLVTTGGIRDLQRGKGDDLEDTCLAVVADRTGRTYEIDFASDNLRVDRRDQYGSWKAPLQAIEIRRPEGEHIPENRARGSWIGGYLDYLQSRTTDLLKTDDSQVPQNLASSIVLLKQRPLVVDRFGNLVKSFSVSFVGFWASRRLADSLPYDYQPKIEVE